MPAVVRRGDANSAGGVATQGAATVLVNGRGVVPPGASDSSSLLWFKRV